MVDGCLTSVCVRCICMHCDHWIHGVVKSVRKREIVRSGNTVEQMARAIADLIVTGAMQPGERLDEISLANRFEVSRTPVREALSQLCAMGLVDRQPNRSAVVTNMTKENLTSMFEAM